MRRRRHHHPSQSMNEGDVVIHGIRRGTKYRLTMFKAHQKPVPDRQSVLVAAVLEALDCDDITQSLATERVERGQLVGRPDPGTEDPQRDGIRWAWCIDGRRDCDDDHVSYAPKDDADEEEIEESVVVSDDSSRKAGSGDAFGHNVRGFLSSWVACGIPDEPLGPGTEGLDGAKEAVCYFDGGHLPFEELTEQVTYPKATKKKKDEGPEFAVNEQMLERRSIPYGSVHLAVTENASEVPLFLMRVIDGNALQRMVTRWRLMDDLVEGQQSDDDAASRFPLGPPPRLPPASSLSLSASS